jgi:hypothetical protein
MAPHMPWIMPSAQPSMPYPGLCWPPNVPAKAPAGRTGNNENASQAARRQKKKLNDEATVEKSTSGQKSRQITVQPGGEVDGACLGKNAWDDTARALVPRILDLSVVDWEGQKPESVQKLRDRLDAEFEYVRNPLSMQGFINAMKRFLKYERSRSKMHYRAGDI